jgi:hypothetical protein
VNKRNKKTRKQYFTSKKKMKISSPALTYLVLILILFLSSCTIEKRVHRKGYHVEWIHSHNKTSGNEQKIMAKQEVTEMTATEKQNSPIVNKEEQHNLKEEFQIDTVTHKKNIAYIKETLKEFSPAQAVKSLRHTTSRFQSSPNKKDTASEKQPLTNKTKEVEKMGLWSLIFAIVGFFVPYLLGLLLFILAVILSISSLAKISGNPDSYSGTGFSIAALILGIIGCAILFF